MDKEGFSGNDGRTTIFDYWSIDTLVRASVNKLNDGEKVLKRLYNKVMKIAATEKAVSEGASFDLMYVNDAYHRQYAFLRKAAKEALLVVANFEDAPVTMPVKIPTHAFDFLHMKEKNAVALEMLSGHKQKIQLKRDGEIVVELPPYGAVVYKFKA